MGEKRVPSSTLYVLMTVWIAIVTALAFAVGPVFSIRSLAVSMVLLGGARLVLPTGFVPDIRGRVWDTLTLVSGGAALLLLSEWGNATVVA